MASEPTARQLEILKVIHEFIELHGISPTRRDVGALANIKSTNGVHEVLEALRKKGVVSFTSHTARSIQLTPKGRALIGCHDNLKVARELWARRNEFEPAEFEGLMTELLEGSSNGT